MGNAFVDLEKVSCIKEFSNFECESVIDGVMVRISVPASVFVDAWLDFIGPEKAGGREDVAEYTIG